jgi:predicted  nucleic acid-binding Zn-ribbon protein
MALFRNFYRCDRCRHKWTDTWSATCDDDCPKCGARHMSPYKSEDEGTDGRDQNTGSAASLSQTDRIRQLNDAFRQTFIGGRVVVTLGVHELRPEANAALIQAVRSFNNFATDNDPHGEHDFGTIVLMGQTFFFKMDYYSPDMQGGSEDPADPEQTTRVLTIMRADEY